jgi:hypothetical protein
MYGSTGGLHTVTEDFRHGFRPYPWRRSSNAVCLVLGAGGTLDNRPLREHSSSNPVFLLGSRGGPLSGVVGSVLPAAPFNFPISLCELPERVRCLHSRVRGRDKRVLRSGTGRRDATASGAFFGGARFRFTLHHWIRGGSVPAIRGDHGTKDIRRGKAPGGSPVFKHVLN